MSIYTRSTLGDPDNQIVFNDTTTIPYYRVQTRAPQKYQIRSEDFPVPFDNGITDFLTLIGETVYVIQGTMYPRDQETYEYGLAKLRSVSSLSLEQTDPYSEDGGYVPYIWGEAAEDKQLFMKVLYVQATENTRQGYVLPFTLVCKIKDPTVYGSTLKTASTALANPSDPTGTFVYPVTYPEPMGLTAYTVTADAFNAGLTSAYPLAVTVYGPATNPKVTNAATGESITVNVTLGGSDILEIVYTKGSFSVTKNGTNVAQSLTTTSTLFRIQPGDNIIELSGTLGVGSYATVAYYDAWDLA